MPPRPRQSHLAAALWDMDGTLVDTEPFWIAAERELMASYGLEWSLEDSEAMVGQALPVVADAMRERGLPLDKREILDRVIADVLDHIERETPWRPGARELLVQLREAGIPCAMVTMSEQILAEAVANQLPEGTFEFLMTGDQVERGKPDPQAYEQAIERLQAAEPGVTKDRVVALEDSIPGVESARRSGAVTIAIPHVVPVPEHPDVAHWDTLDGKSVQDLEAVVSERAFTS